MTLEQINNMTREELVAEEIEATVAKWGEEEREPAKNHVRLSSDAGLRASIAMRVGADPLKVKGARVVKKVARHCLDNGAS